MDARFRNLPIEDRIRIVEELWDSIAHDQNALPLTKGQKAELDRRLDALELVIQERRPATFTICLAVLFLHRLLSRSGYRVA